MYQQPPKPPLQSSGPQSGIFNSVFGGTVVNKQQNQNNQYETAAERNNLGIQLVQP